MKKMDEIKALLKDVPSRNYSLVVTELLGRLEKETYH
jgi:hypothetical protein